MKKDRVNVKVVPDERRSKNDKRFPLKLRITYKGVRKYYATGYDSTEEEWDMINSADAKASLRKIKQEIGIIEKDAQKCCDDITPFSFFQFEKAFFGEKIQFENVESAYKDYIAKLKANEQFGTADSYTTSLNSLKRFKSKLHFEQVTKEFLHSFETWMLAAGKSVTTVGIYLRPLRTIMNIAKENGIIKPEAYPFGKRKYIIPTGRNIKKSLTKAQIKQIFDYETEPGSGMEKAKDFWIFSYLCNGINMMDIAILNQKDIFTSYITFIREKTKRTTKGNPITITATRNIYINRILAKWGHGPANGDDFVFDIAEKGDSPALIRTKVKQFTKVTNKWMKRIGEALEFEMPVTTYVARHSYATILVQSGAPLKLASANLGHQSLITTERYFAGFELSTQAQYAKALIDF
ncbi:phage integrase SAM-like domain-containing protein [Chitinophaga sp. RCC_12]|uniref:phage integrase SAM-like domain-containing protein n=1 Tax=Chitinophaga sp. RCC_12 TaxID=3239226 RepID=UPI003523BC59